MTKTRMELQPTNLASIFRGLYVRVASRLGVDPSYVSRVARGERNSKEVETVLEQETRKILSQLAKPRSRNGRMAGRNSANRNGSSRISVDRRKARAGSSPQN